MAEGETSGVASTEEVEVELPPLKRVGYIENIERRRYEIKLRIYKDYEDYKSIHIYVGDVHVITLLATEVKEGASGIWFYADGLLIAYLPLDEVEDST